MSETLTQLMASDHWPYIWPCYTLAGLVFVGLTVRAVARLRHWKARARREEQQ